MWSLSEVDAERRALNDRNALRIMLNIAEEYRRLATSIDELLVTEDDLIAFIPA